ncbi:unnamed protein product [Vitrella brassicaformis CCMP3155]|uniref:histidine--tRNA ligase n=1 Tax=Vitrella brassicaformis (strain CCMP3155) TaxID=1169540 RepID=A0A0G4EM40_VITBC|nr:unnamed protein product [Vitrella brassicaformis CCMP3155]|eukprot:CEL98510.1 unnamed protein product [Vitrella brassicaformis CCMP3155]
MTLAMLIFAALTEGIRAVQRSGREGFAFGHGRRPLLQPQHRGGRGGGPRVVRSAAADGQAVAVGPVQTTEAEVKTPAAAGRRSAAVVQTAGGTKESGVKEAPLDLNPPRGTRDFFPDDMRLRNWLFDKWRRASELYGFEEFDAPVLESEDLYIRKAGEEVVGQLYCFADKGGRRVALRPELTPSLARMVLAKRGQLNMPIKWFAIPQCWRYERMTRGRRREHYQWNCDIWGVGEVTAEMELLSCIVRFFESVGIGSDDVGIKVNNRELLREVLHKNGVPDDRFAAVCVLIDKLEKVPLDHLRDDFRALGVEGSQLDSIAASVRADQTVDDVAQLVGEDSQAVKHLRDVFDMADAYGIADWLVFDPSVVRGLAYYTGVVFEGFDRAGELRAICGGGRYDTLLEMFGGEPIPAVGFGFGDAVVVELLKTKGLLPDFADTSVADAVVWPLAGGDETSTVQQAAGRVATRLRQSGLKTDVILENKKSKWVFKHAARVNAGVLVVIGADEVAGNEVTAKRLCDKEQQRVTLDGTHLEDLAAEWAMGEGG